MCRLLKQQKLTEFHPQRENSQDNRLQNVTKMEANVLLIKMIPPTKGGTIQYIAFYFEEIVKSDFTTGPPSEKCP